MLIRNILLLLATAVAAHAGIDRIENRAGQNAAVAGDVIDLIGSGFSTQTAAISDWPLPFTLAGVQVLCDNYPAPVLAVSPNRVRIQLPWELAGLSSAGIRIVRNGVVSEPAVIPLAVFSPAIIGASHSSAAAGQTVTFRVIGVGPRNRNPAGGGPPSSSDSGAAMVAPLVLIGSTPAPVTANALATGNPIDDAGVQNISVRVSSNAEGGANSVILRMGNVQSDPVPLSIVPGDIQVAISPASIQILPGGRQKLTAKVQGSDDQNVQWSIDNVGSGNFFATVFGGQLSVGSMPSPPWLVVRAAHASGAFGTALVEFAAQDHKKYRITPEFPVVGPGESVTFSVLDENGAAVNGAVWFQNGSTGSNIYTAPQIFQSRTVSITAYVPGPSGGAFEATSTLLIPKPSQMQITGVSPAIVHVGETVTFQGVDTGVPLSGAWFTTASGDRVRSPANSQREIAVPRGSVSGPAWVELRASDAGPTFLSAPFAVTVLSRLRLHATRLRIAAGESVQIVAAAPDAPIAASLSWRADLGTVNAKGVFTAPPVNSPAFARIWACQTAGSECGTVVVKVLPLRLDPDPLVLDPGETVQLRAMRGGAEVTATWQARSANATVTESGKLTVGKGPIDGGQAIVIATASGVSQEFEISIRTAGVVAHATEYYDWLGYDNNSPTGRVALGVFTRRVAVKGKWLYALSQSLQYGNYIGAWQTTWIDAYKLDERKNPVWVDSVGTPRFTASLDIVGNTLIAAGQDSGNVLLRYDISSGSPVFRGSSTFDGDASLYASQGSRLTVTPYETPGPITFDVRDLPTGQVRKFNTNYVPFAGYSASGVAGATWAAILIDYSSASGAHAEVAIFDITSPDAALIALLPVPYTVQLTIMKDLLIAGAEVYRVSGGNVTLVSQLPGQSVLDSDPSTARLLMAHFFYIQEDGYNVVDLSDPVHPKVSAAAVHPDQSTTGKLGDDFFVLLGGGQNFAVYPILWQPGVRKVDSFPATPWMNAARARDGYLYWVGPGWGYKGRTVSMGILEVDDVSSVPSRVVAAMDRPGDQVAWAIELNGSYAYVGTDTELIVYNISAPWSPVQGVVLPAPAISLALSGKYLYAGSNTATATVLLVYDVSDPARPKLVATLSLPDFAYGISAQGGSLSVALGKSGISFYSLANPATPVQTGHFAETVWDVTGDANQLYAAGDTTGLIIYDITSPSSPTTNGIATMAVGNELWGSSYPAALGVTYDPRGIVWTATGKEGRVYGIDVRNPRAPRHVAELETGAGVTGYSAAGTAVAGNHLYIAGNDADFEIAAPQNVGLYGFAQPSPGSIQPDRYDDKAPVGDAPAPPENEPLKSRVLNGREPVQNQGAPAHAGRSFRREKPINSRM